MIISAQTYGRLLLELFHPAVGHRMLAMAAKVVQGNANLQFTMTAQDLRIHQSGAISPVQDV